MALATLNLCIGCWYAECGGAHPDPDLECPCCTGLIEPTNLGE